uniref:Ig-like domain-containing protein n=1 Tax=Denticeps clupeoides TaxID=299321 RepID=A0AAY4BCU3_9TELE
MVKEGDNAVFSCELSKPGSLVEWRKGRVILKSGEKYDIRLEGRYSKLVIPLPAKFTKELTNQEADEGSVVTLCCELSKSGAPLVWRKGAEVLRNGKEIKVGKRHHISNNDNGTCSLEISNATSKDAGIYTCEAVNKFGTTSYNGNVTVQIPRKASLKSQGVETYQIEKEDLRQAYDLPSARQETTSKEKRKSSISGKVRCEV